MVKDGRDTLGVDKVNGLPMRKQIRDDTETWCGVTIDITTHPEGAETEGENTQRISDILGRSDDRSVKNGNMMNQLTQILTNRMLAMWRSRRWSQRNGVLH
jgi:hypothetical protein